MLEKASPGKIPDGARLRKKESGVSDYKKKEGGDGQA